MQIRPALRRRREALVAAVVVLAFTAVLIAWTRGSKVHAVSISTPATSSAVSSSGATPSAPPTPTARRSAAAGAGVAGDLTPSLPESVLLNAAGKPAHSVELTATSDRRILRMGYIVAGANPQRRSAALLAPPIEIVTVGHGDGVLAAFGVQADPQATYLTCTVTVDGRVRITQTVHGGWAVANCVG